MLISLCCRDVTRTTWLSKMATMETRVGWKQRVLAVIEPVQAEDHWDVTIECYWYLGRQPKDRKYVLIVCLWWVFHVIIELWHRPQEHLTGNSRDPSICWQLAPTNIISYFQRSFRIYTVRHRIVITVIHSISSASDTSTLLLSLMIIPFSFSVKKARLTAPPGELIAFSVYFDISLVIRIRWILYPALFTFFKADTHQCTDSVPLKIHTTHNSYPKALRPPAHACRIFCCRKSHLIGSGVTAFYQMKFKAGSNFISYLIFQLRDDLYSSFKRAFRDSELSIFIGVIIW